MTQERLEADRFKCRHRQSEKAFTRERSLPFALVLVLVLVLVLRNSVKS
jgi:hypothetical protein